MKKIVAINGSGGSGKDTFVNYCKEFVHVTHTSYVNYIRNEIAPRLGYKGGKTEKDRKFLSDLQDISSGYNDFPYEVVDDEIQDFWDSFTKDGDNYVLFVDVREPKVIQRMVDDYGAKTLLVTRSDAPEITSNHADAEVNNYNYDYKVVNDGTLENLRHAAEIFCKEKLFRNNFSEKCEIIQSGCEKNPHYDWKNDAHKTDILSTIDTALKGYNPKNMVPVSYELLEQISYELKKRRMEE